MHMSIHTQVRICTKMLLSLQNLERVKHKLASGLSKAAADNNSTLGRSYFFELLPRNVLSPISRSVTTGHSTAAAASDTI